MERSFNEHNQRPLYNAHSDRNIRRGQPIQNSVNQGTLYNSHSDRNIRKGYFRNSVPDAKVIREFRVVKDNRTNQNPNSEIKPPAQRQMPSNALEVQHSPDKRYISYIYSDPVGFKFLHKNDILLDGFNSRDMILSGIHFK